MIMLRKDLDDLDINGQKGDWCFISREITIHDTQLIVPDYYIAIRFGDNGIKDTCILPIAKKWREESVPRENISYWTEDNKAAWEWDGNREAPTLSPSILVHGGKDQPDQWHGYLRSGKLVNA